MLTASLSTNAHAQDAGQSTWMLSLDVIKSKAEQLVVINRQLVAENNDIAKGLTKLQAAVQDSLAKNKKLSDFLAQRHGRTDQQMEIEDLQAKINLRKQAMLANQQQVEDRAQDVVNLNRKVAIKKLRISEWELQKKAKEVEMSYTTMITTSDVPTDDDLKKLRKDIESHKTVEAELEAKINELTKSKTTNSLDATSLRADNIQLQQQLDTLTKEINFREKQQKTSPVDTSKYNAMMSRKKDLEEKIKVYERQIDVLKDPSNFTLTWDKEKKRLINSMAQADSRNQQLRGKIDDIKNDIAILRDSIAKLERRVNFEQGVGISPKQ